MNKTLNRPAREDTHWLDPPQWWKKWRPLRWIAIGIIGVGVGSGLWTGAKLVMAPGDHPDTEHYKSVEKQRALLIDFYSYDALELVTSRLSSAGYKWTVKKNHRLPSPEFPPRDLDTLTVDAYQHLNNEGTLTLEFFNNRLYQTQFVPKDPATYSVALHRAEPRLTPDRVGKVEFLAGYLRIASNVDLAKSDVGQTLHSTPYAIWQDLRLVRQRNEWDEAFGSIPATMMP